MVTMTEKRTRLYRVGVPEIHFSYRVVQASSPEEARELAPAEDEVELTFERTFEEMDVDEWPVEEVENNEDEQ